MYDNKVSIGGYPTTSSTPFDSDRMPTSGSLRAATADVVSQLQFPELIQDLHHKLNRIEFISGRINAALFGTGEDAVPAQEPHCVHDYLRLMHETASGAERTLQNVIERLGC